jgi:hypothetical protein
MRTVYIFIYYEIHNEDEFVVPVMLTPVLNI